MEVKMRIEAMDIKDIKAAKYNPRKDLQPGDEEYEKLKKSIEEFDMVEPLVWNQRSGNLIGGHQRLKVLKDLGHEKVEVSVVDLPTDKERALNIALNKISGDWDIVKLKDLLEELDSMDYDLTITGFDEEELSKILFEDMEDKEREPKDNPPAMKVVFEKPEDFKRMEDDLRELIKAKYENVPVSISGGEV